jgi:hypothetical protein
MVHEELENKKSRMDNGRRRGSLGFQSVSNKEGKKKKEEEEEAKQKCSESKVYGRRK